MVLVACGDTGFGDWISESERGRPLGMSVPRARASRREVEECLLEELECLLLEDDLLEDDDFDDLLDLSDFSDFPDGTSRMFNIRPVVGSIVEDWEGSCETWHPSMI